MDIAETPDNSTIESIQASRPWYLTVIVTLLGVSAMIGNSIVLIIVIKNPKLLKSARKFCIHLAVTDVGNGVFVLANVIGGLAGGDTSVPLCITLTWGVLILSFTSYDIMTLINVERYVAICKPHYHKLMSKKKINVGLAISWVFALFLCCLGFAAFDDDNSHRFCIYLNLFHKWMFLVQALSMLILTLFNTILFILVLVKARRFYNRIKNKQRSKTQLTNDETVKQRKLAKSIRNGKIMGYVTLACMLCWSPYNIVQFYVGLGYPISQTLISVANGMYIIGIVSSCVNPVLYSWQKKEFRLQFKRYFCLFQNSSQNSSRNDGEMNLSSSAGV